MAQDVLDNFLPAVRRWFRETLGEPTPPQAEGWPPILRGEHTLIAAPTGSGKTLAAFLAGIDQLARDAVEGVLTDRTRIVYVSPLKALSNDIERNLRAPLAGIRERLDMPDGTPLAEIRAAVRTGDTPSHRRTAMVRTPPHILVTTPESLYLLLTADGGRSMLAHTRSIIVDEIHAVAPNRRGSHLALTLERLDALVDQHGHPPVQRIGLSATQKPIELVARFLTGTAGMPDSDERTGSTRLAHGPAPANDSTPPAAPCSEAVPCSIIDTGHQRSLDIDIELPQSPLSAVMAAEVMDESHDRLVELIQAHASTLIFVNTRRTAERFARDLAARLGPDVVSSHHGSLSREKRLDAERRLESGELKALVATASLELGIDVGHIDLVCQIGTTRRISTLLQRIGRAGHAVGRTAKGRLFPTTRDELVEAVALMDAVRRGELDALTIPEAPLDILAQQVVAMSAVETIPEDTLFERVRRAWPWRDLPRETFDEVLEMLAEGFSTRRGRRGALIHRDATNGVVRGRRAAQLRALTSGGAIPEVADYDVVIDETDVRVGSVHEDFAVESMPGDIFQLGNTSWRIVRVETGRVRVNDAQGQPPTLPFWFGEAPSRSHALSHAVSRLREEVHALTRDAGDRATALEAARRKLVERLDLDVEVVTQLVDFLAAGAAALDAMPTTDRLVVERFFDETGGQQLVIHAPFGSRLNRAWGLALRKCFCQQFNFELQAAANEDAILLSLGPTHSFELMDVFEFLSPAVARDKLVQALLDAPMFSTRWRWNTTRALAVPRWQGGRRVPPQLQRMRADDLIAVVFPDQLACLENVVGKREIPDHPLVDQTVRDCLVEAMDIEGLEALLTDIRAGRKELVARDTTEPSPFAGSILNAMPYAFLDDAPLEERRTQAVISRRWLDPETASDLAALDTAAIERVCQESWPTVESADEAHDALLLMGFITADEAELGSDGWRVATLHPAQRADQTTQGADGDEREESAQESWHGHFEELLDAGRVCCFMPGTPDGVRLWVAAEYAGALERATDDDERSIEPLVEILRCRMAGVGPCTAAQLGRTLGIAPGRVEIALSRLVAEGELFEGRYAPGCDATQWCERRNLARIHRLTLDRLRSEIRPVSKSDFVRFLHHWHRLDVPEGERGKGPERLMAIVEQLEGVESAASAWEPDVLAARIDGYDPAWLDQLCQSGRVVWTRLRHGSSDGGSPHGPMSTTPIALLTRARLDTWQTLCPPPPVDGGDAADDESDGEAAVLGREAQRVLDVLREHGALFFDEIRRRARLLRSQVEEALGELVSSGRVTSDAFVGLRALLIPSARRPGRSSSRRRTSIWSVADAGRWSVRRPAPEPESPFEAHELQREAGETAARILLRRYGVVFRALLGRETSMPPWRVIVRALRRMEARGEVRGGRFVAGFTGQQFALPEAVGTLREIRRRELEGTLVSLSAADPLNLVGVLEPSGRIPSTPDNRVLYRDGIAIAALVSGEVRWLRPPDDESNAWPLTQVLRRQPELESAVAARLRA